MRISQLSEATGVSPRSLRYYEQRELLESVRTANGYREYSEDAVATVLTIRSLLDLGFPSEMVRAVLPCATGTVSDGDVCQGLVERIAQVRDEVSERVDRLTQSRDTLTGFLAGKTPDLGDGKTPA